MGDRARQLIESCQPSLVQERRTDEEVGKTAGTHIGAWERRD